MRGSVRRKRLPICLETGRLAFKLSLPRRSSDTRPMNALALSCTYDRRIQSRINFLSCYGENKSIFPFHPHNMHMVLYM